MSVYVDALRWRGMTIRGRDVKSCHLTADSLEELKAFAEKIGITSDWIHHGSRPHFDLVSRFRGAAIANGATAIRCHGRKKTYE